jgi:hypothetical protein
MLRLQDEPFKYNRTSYNGLHGRTDSCAVVIIVYSIPVTHDNNNSDNFSFPNYVWLVHYFTVFNIPICYRLKIKIN